MLKVFCHRLYAFKEFLNISAYGKWLIANGKRCIDNFDRGRRVAFPACGRGGTSELHTARRRSKAVKRL